MTENTARYVERETTLVVCSNRPDEVYRAIANISKMPGVRLGSQEKIVIRDTYFDTSGAALQAIQWALRTRETESETLITLKGPSRRSESGAVERTEIEAEWSDAAVSKVVGLLEVLGIELPEERGNARPASPVQFMQHLGLCIVQQRETLRLLRKAFARGEASLPVAELAVDAVTYRFDDRAVVHHELEMEARSRRGLDAVRVMASTLSDMFGDVLRTWEHSKLATGWALKRLYRQGSLEPHIKDGLLLPSAYDEIDALLKHRPRKGVVKPRRR